MTFYDFFDTSFQKNVKSHVFLKLDKKKNTYSRTLRRAAAAAAAAGADGDGDV